MAMDHLDRLLRWLMAVVTPRGVLPDRDPERTWQALEGFELGIGRDLLTEKLLGHALELVDIEAAYRVLDSRRAARGGSPAS